VGFFFARRIRATEENELFSKIMFTRGQDVAFSCCQQPLAQLTNQNKMTTTTTLSHNQEITVKGFTLASKITVGTARGYAAKYNDNADAAHALAIANGHDTAWTNQKAAILTSNYPGKDEALDLAARNTAAAQVIEDGQVVTIEDEDFQVRVLGQRFSDPVRFIRIA